MSEISTEQAAASQAVKHAPGPWEIIGRTGSGKAILIESVTDDGWERLACEVESDDCDLDMALANARLIAAAPDLLALVERAVSVLQRHIIPDGISDHEALNELYSIFDGPEYRAAIAKTEGRAE